MRRHAAITLGVAALAAQLTVAPVPAARAAVQMQWGIKDPVHAVRIGAGCWAAGGIWVRELGSSGVNRLRVQWQLRSHYDTGILPTHAKTGWFKSVQFLNDSASRYNNFVLPPGHLNLLLGNADAVWAKMVGERPSFWKPDLVMKGRHGFVAPCEPLLGRNMGGG
jgi:hypothetical protein